MNWLFKLLPRQFQRWVTRGQRDFSAAETNRLTLDWMASLKSADEEVKRDALKLRARARELARNNAYAKQFLRILGNNVIGPHGFNHQALVRNNDGEFADLINDKIEAGFAEWSHSVTLDGKLSLVQFEHQQLTGEARDGEALIRMWRGADNAFGFALEPIDPDLLDHEMNAEKGKGSRNGIRMGIELDNINRPVAYWLWDGPYDWLRDRKRLRIPADEIIHLYDPERSNQTRGVTWFHPVMLPLHILAGYVEAELVASRVTAAKMGFWERIPDSLIGEKSALDGATPKAPASMNAAPGTLDYAPDGYKLNMFDPDHPSTAFGDFMKNVLREIASGLGITYATLGGDLSDANYSSMKVGQNGERDVWRMHQQNWIRNFRRRIYPEFLNFGLMKGAATGGRQGLVLDSREFSKLLEVRWSGRGWPSPDPLKDVTAAIAEIGHGLSTRTEYIAERGGDFEEVLEQLAKEMKFGASKGVPLSDAQAAAAVADKQKSSEQEDALAAKKKSLTNGHSRIAALQR